MGRRRSIEVRKAHCRDLVVEALRKGQSLGLIDIAVVVRLVSLYMSIDEAHATLRKLAREGKLELRPDVFGVIDKVHTPPGPRGTWFMYGRWLDKLPLLAVDHD